ncbi:MAG TPA: aminotransferase class III-fold pyridoxal phosphate-dependent enzyme, partial [Gaiellaceae bacterium]|nr:aminotransferase class III-fold pyridoxal phosphate-dependent enzyme [Gaiellaceae bacterium]
MTRVAGERILAAPPDRVWTLLTDAHELARAMPGAGEVEPEDGRTFRTTISLSVGPVKDTYEGRLGYEDERPPTACTIVVETKGRSGRLAGRGAMRLESHDVEQTLLHYEGDFKVSGPVAGVGQRMIAGVARKTIERTLDGIGRRLGDAQPPAAATAAAAKTTSAFWHPFANMATVAGNELVIVNGDGCEVVGADGRSYLDATAALWYCNVGYGRAEIASAVERLLRKLHAYSTFGVYGNEPALALADRLARLSPLEEGKVFFTSGGSDAVDTAAK